MSFQSVDLNDHSLQIYESKHKAGAHVRPHFHDVYQLLVILEGTGEISLFDKPAPVKPDDIVFVAPFTRHSVSTQGNLTLLVLAFDKDACLGASAAQLDPFLRESLWMSLNPLVAPEIKTLLRKILYEQANPKPLSGLAIQIQLTELLLHLYRSLQTDSSEDFNSVRAERIRQYIDSRYYAALTASELSRRLGISTRYMNDIFKAQFGLTPMQYLASTRVEKAKDLLTETDKDIISVCFEVGYETVSVFYRAFKQKTGHSPHRYRTIKQLPAADMPE